MKILVTHSTNYDFKTYLYAPIRNSELNSKYDFVLPHETTTIPFTRPLMEKKEIQIQIAKVSLPSTGQGIELGWAEVFHTPIVCIYKKGNNYSGSLNFIEYSDPDDMIMKLSEFLKKYES